MTDEPFELKRAPARRGKARFLNNDKQKQVNLLHGLDCLPGQQDLFNTMGDDDAHATRTGDDEDSGEEVDST